MGCGVVNAQFGTPCIYEAFKVDGGELFGATEDFVKPPSEGGSIVECTGVEGVEGSPRMEGGSSPFHSTPEASEGCSTPLHSESEWELL